MRVVSCFVCVACASALGLSLSGCGGGGGGGGSHSGGGGGGTGDLYYFANFSPGPAGGPTGKSEVVTIETSSGAVLGSKTVNAPTSFSTLPEVQFQGLPNATLYLSATLYSGTNGTGTATGSFSEIFASNTSIPAVTGVIGQPVASVQIGPAAQWTPQGQPTQYDVALSQGSNLQLTATAQDTNGDCVFESKPATWSVTQNAGSVANINPSGLLSGLSAGQASVQAAYGSATASAPVAVTGVSSGTWTIMVFMDSANDLDGESYVNIAQLEQIAKTAASPTRFIVQWKLSDNPLSEPTAYHTFNSTERFVVVNGGLEMVQNLGPSVDMGAAATLQSFVNWGAANYPAQHYAMVMWDHGSGWSPYAKPKIQQPKWRGISYDFVTGNHIDVWQLGTALSGVNLDIISFDACLMQMIEVQDEVKSAAHYMVCSEDNTPAPGYPYNVSFAQFVSNPTAPVTTLAQSIVNGYFNVYDQSSTYGSTSLSHSVVDLTKVPAVVSALGSLSTAILNSGMPIGAAQDTMSTLRQNSLCYDAPDGYFFYDIGSVAKRFANASWAPSSVQIAAQNLFNAEHAAVVYSQTDGHSPDSTGISLEFGSQPNFAQLATAYQNLQVGKSTTWGQALNNPVDNPSP